MVAEKATQVQWVEHEIIHPTTGRPYVVTARWGNTRGGYGILSLSVEPVIYGDIFPDDIMEVVADSPGVWVDPR